MDVTSAPTLSDFRVTRLNASLFPVDEFESASYTQFGLHPELVEAKSVEETIRHVKRSDALLVVSASLPTEVIQSMEHCRIISRLGTGTDKIDVSEATTQGIVVSNVPNFCVEEQADHTMALLLALVRQLNSTYRDLRQGAWRRARSNPHFMRLSGHTLGLIGFGRSARAVAKRAEGFGLHVLATRLHQDASSEVASELGVQMTDLENLLKVSDFVSLHLPLNDHTYHLLDDEALRKLKPDALLINTARGAIVDEYALAEALKKGRLAGAGIDTYELINPFSEEETPPEHPFFELDNVVLTPHIASISPQAKYDVATGGVENLVAVLSGHWAPSENIVNQDVVPRRPLAPHDPLLYERVIA